jgi:hypothetical protein
MPTYYALARVDREEDVLPSLVVEVYFALSFFISMHEQLTIKM